MADDEKIDENTVEAERRELVEMIAEREIELQRMKARLLEVQNLQMQAAIKRRSAK